MHASDRDSHSLRADELSLPFSSDAVFLNGCFHGGPSQAMASAMKEPTTVFTEAPAIRPLVKDPHPPIERAARRKGRKPDGRQLP
jgi:hypothetical protein